MSINRRKFLQAAGVGAGLGLTGASSAFHNSDFGVSPISGRPYIQPTYGDIGNMQVLGYCDMTFQGTGKAGGWDQIYDFKVRDTPRGRFAYCPNGAPGWSIVDVTNPRNMFVTYRQPWDSLPDNSNYLGISESTGLMVPKRNNKIEVWDVNDPYNPTLQGVYVPPDQLGSHHGLQVVDGTGPYRGRVFVYVASRFVGYTDMILQILDITDPKNIRPMSRWHYPGMGPGETPTWPATGVTVQMHDCAVYGDRVYVAWRDKGLIILDTSDITRPKMVGEVNWADLRGGGFDSEPGQTHKFGLVVPEKGGPIETIVSEDEVNGAGTCPFGHMKFFDIRDETRPVQFAEFKMPINFHGNCPIDRLGQRMGTHDMITYITTNHIWTANEEGGFWVVDISDAHHPKAAAWFVPPVRSDSARMTGHADDVILMSDGVCFGSSSDAQAGGLWAMRYRKGVYGKVRWNAEENGVVTTQVPRNDGGAT